MKKIHCLLLLCILISWSSAADASGFINYKGIKMFHDDKYSWCQRFYFRYSLTPQNIILTLESYVRPHAGKSKYALDCDTFDIYIKKDYFPVKKTAFDGYFITRPAFTHYDFKKNAKGESIINASKEGYIERLFREIGKMKVSGKGKVDVVLMMAQDPGLKILSRDPWEFDITTSNIYIVTDPWILKKFGLKH